VHWSRLDLGVGLVAAAGADLLWPGVADLVDVVEIEPQTMWLPLPGGGWQLSEAAYQWRPGLAGRRWRTGWRSRWAAASRRTRRAWR
jgi:hypothetical protein